MPTAEAEEIMNQQDPTPPSAPAKLAAAQSRIPPPAPPVPPTRAAWGGYIVVALIALLLGAAATFVGLRYFGTNPGVSSEETSTTGATPAGAHESMPGMDVSGGASTTRPAGIGEKAVQISSERQQLIGVRTSTVTHHGLSMTVRTVGTLAYDETRVTQVHVKVSGWVDKLYVDYVGKLVRRGQPLFTLYSPDLVSTQKEYLLALKAREQLGSSQFEETRAGAASLVSAARDRLMLWDISDAQIAELERTREPQKTLTLFSPFSGVVLERNTFAGQYITPETNTFKIADLSTIWVIGQVFEYELRNLKIGQDADIEFPYGQSTRTLKGKVTFIYPEIDPQTRRAKVRIEFRNPGLEFKPESYVTVVLHTQGGHQLAIPKEALIDDGNRQYAILAQPNGFFEPREIKVGPPVDEYFPVISGLEMGDRIVTSAQFLVDSETNLQAAMKAMSMSMPGMDMGGGDMKGMDMSPAPKGGVKPDDSMKGMDHSQHQGTPNSPAKPSGHEHQQQ